MRFRVLILAVAVAALIAAGIALAATARTCPSVDALAAYRPPEASRVFASDGSLIADLSPQRRIVVGLDEISPALVEGFIAVEDRRFREHGGIDARGVMRAVWRNARSLSIREGFSTITMQLTRNVFPEALPHRDRLRRKACEVMLAGRVEDRFEKAEILALYMNQIYLGDGLYGVEAAAQGYFGKRAADLRASEAALLIGLAKSPSGYNPRRHPMAAVRRRNVVLDVMAREGVIAADAAAEAKIAPLALAPPPSAAGPAPFFVAAVRRELRDRFGEDADTRGLRVYTDLDPELQRATHERLVAQIERIEAGELGAYPHAARLNSPDGGAESAENGSPYLQGMALIMDPRTGGIRALVGGRDFAESQFDRALQARRQPGSAFKPIVYAAALADGLPTTARIDLTEREDGVGPEPTWRPGDHLPDSVDAISLREALTVSSNRAAVRVGEWVGERRVIRTARALGLTTEIPEFPSIFLGAAEVSPAELVAAYAAFGNGGYRVRPRLIARVEDDEGELLWQAPLQRERALEAGVAFLTLDLLEDVVDHGTGASVRQAGFTLPAAGKTGTTNEAKDVWFIGVTPDLVGGVWLGFDQPRPIMPGASGGRLAAPVWAELMATAYRDRPLPPAWIPPESVIGAAVDTASGLLATGDCPHDHVRQEFFLPGTEPVEHCTLHPEGGVERVLERVWGRIRGFFGGSNDADTTGGGPLR